jgi:hypothetical protein
MADEEDPDRAAILRRRRRFVAVALGALATQAACGEPQVCLSIAIGDAGPGDAGDAAVRPDAQTCLGMDAGPLPTDGGSDAGARDGGRDATVIGLDGSIPTPCLSMVPPDAAPEKR